MDKILENLSSVSISFPPFSFTTVQFRSSLIVLLYIHIPSQSIKIRQNHSQKNILKIVKYAKKLPQESVLFLYQEAVSYDSLYIFDLIYTNRCFFTLLSVIHTIMNALLPLLKTFDRIFYIIRKNFNHLCIFRLIPYDTHFLKCLSGNITPQCHQYATVRYDQHIFRLPF